MSSFQSRLELKTELAASRVPDFARLPFQCHLLVVGTPHRQTDAPPSVEILRSRLTGQRGDYYYVAVYYEASYSHREFQFIAHEALECVNLRAVGPKWRIPLRLCQDEAALTAPTAFCLYQHDHFSLPAHFTGRKMQLAFDMRIKLFKWLAMDAQFQDAHPLSDLEARYAGISQNEKVFDSAVYFLFVHAISPDSCIPWLDGEELLLRYKLMLRPALAAKVCEIVGEPYSSLVDTLPKLRRLHQINTHRVRDQGIFVEPRFDAVASAAIAELLRIKELRLEDTAVDEMRAELLQPSAAPPKLKTQLGLGDIRECAPKCMKRILELALGTPAQQSSLKPIQRDRLNQFLLENGLDAQEVSVTVRPRIMIAYEMEQPEQSWAEISDGVGESQTTRDANHVATGLAFQTCFDVMRAELCPYTRPRLSSWFALTQQQRKASAKSNFVATKKKCHDDLVEIFQKRKKELKVASGAENVKRAWTMSPQCFTQVAAKGEKANIDKAEEDKAAQKKKKQKT